MRTSDDRYSRQAALFGRAGQYALATARLTIIGLGGLGSHVAQQLAFLGIEHFHLIDPDRVSRSNLNRLVGAVESDVQSFKVDVVASMITSVQPQAEVTVLSEPVAAVPSAPFRSADVVLSCVDSDCVRVEIVQRCVAAGSVYFDLATDTGEARDGPWFGGRVLFSGEGERCPSCMDLLDQAALRSAAMTPGQQAEEARIYGVDHHALHGTGPAVISVNGVVASLAVTELIKWRTGIAEPAPLITYRGDRGTVHRSVDPGAKDCYYCAEWKPRPMPTVPSSLPARLMCSTDEER